MRSLFSTEKWKQGSGAFGAAAAQVQRQREKEHRTRVRRTLEGNRRRFLAAAGVAAVTLGSGVLNLFSIMGGPSRHLLQEVFPLEFVRFSRTSTLLIGFALIISSINIYRRKRRAWAIVLGLSILSAFFQITRGLHYEEASTSLVLVIILLVTRRTFSVRSSIPDVRGTLGRLIVAAAVAIGYGVAGFWLLDEKHFGINFHIGDAVATTLRLLSLNTDPRLIPRTPYAHWFLDSLYVITFVAVFYGAFALFRPVIYQFRIVPRERQLASAIVEQFGRTTMDFFKLWQDKSYFFSPTNQCFIAYGVAGNVAVVLGDPVGSEAEIEPTVREFLEFCRDNGWTVGFHQTLPDFLPVYKKIGLKKLKIGDDAIVELSKFSIEGKSKRAVRYKSKQFEAMGIETRHYEAPVPDEILRQIKQVSDEWLQIPGRRERTFTLGYFDENYLRSTPVFVVVDKDERILAFINLLASHSQGEITGDLMRRRTDAPNGIMDYLFVTLFLYCKQQGYQRFNLGMAPMSGFQEREEASAEERAIHGFFQQLNFIFSFRGLRHYKAKFATRWEPRYLIYRNALELPRIALALRRVSEVNSNVESEEQEVA